MRPRLTLKLGLHSHLGVAAYELPETRSNTLQTGPAGDLLLARRAVLEGVQRARRAHVQGGVDELLQAVEIPRAVVPARLFFMRFYSGSSRLCAF